MVSVIMPTKDRVEYVQRAVNSVLGQTFKNLELVILDDSSPESYAKLMLLEKQDERIRLVRRKGTGLDERRRIGVELAMGKYITFLDSDDYWSEEMLDDHLRIWATHKVGLTWGKWVLIVNGKEHEPRVGQPFPPNTIIPPLKVARALFIDNFLPPCVGLTSKRIIESLGGWPVRSLVSDWLMFISIAERYPALMLDKVFYYRDMDAPATVSKTKYFTVLKDEAKMRRHLFFSKPQIYWAPFGKMILHLPISLAAGAKNADWRYMKSRTIRLFGW